MGVIKVLEYELERLKGYQKSGSAPVGAFFRKPSNTSNEEWIAISIEQTQLVLQKFRDKQRKQHQRKRMAKQARRHLHEIVINNTNKNITKQIKKEDIEFLKVKLDSNQKSPDGLYFVQAGNFIKIGRAIDMKNRLKGIQNGNPLKCKLLLFLENKGYLERDLHRIFKSIRANGEWFKADDSIYVLINEVLED